MVRYSSEELSLLCLGLAHLLRAGLPSADALTLMAQDETEQEKKQLLQNMAEKADEGVPLSSVFRASGTFDQTLWAMVAAGEETGRLEESLRALADHFDTQARLEHSLKTALLQPMTLLGVLAAVIIVLLGWVLPVFEDVYGQLGASLTGIAGGLMLFGRGIRGAVPVLMVLAAAFCVGAWYLMGTWRGFGRLMSFVQKRGWFSLMDTVRLTSILNMGLGSGLGSERAIELAAQMSEPGTKLKGQCEQCLALLQGSVSFPKALAEAGLLSAADSRLLEAGFRSGCADTVMGQLALRIRQRSEEQMARRLGRIEPTLVLICSVLVGVILLSVLCRWPRSWQQSGDGMKRWLLPILAVILIVFFLAVDSVKTTAAKVGREQLERALRQAAVACYASEGRFPPDVAYLEQNYGIQISENYAVSYDVIAENLMPDITVLERP